jgi:hypothetical protein
MWCIAGTTQWVDPPPEPPPPPLPPELRANVAMTDLAELMVRWQIVAVPLQTPDHPVNLEPDAASALSVTLVPLA